MFVDQSQIPQCVRSARPLATLQDIQERDIRAAEDDREYGR